MYSKLTPNTESKRLVSVGWSHSLSNSFLTGLLSSRLSSSFYIGVLFARVLYQWIWLVGKPRDKWRRLRSFSYLNATFLLGSISSVVKTRRDENSDDNTTEVTINRHKECLLSMFVVTSSVRFPRLIATIQSRHKVRIIWHLTEIWIGGRLWLKCVVGYSVRGIHRKRRCAAIYPSPSDSTSFFFCQHELRFWLWKQAICCGRQVRVMDWVGLLDHFFFCCWLGLVLHRPSLRPVLAYYVLWVLVELLHFKIRLQLGDFGAMHTYCTIGRTLRFLLFARSKSLKLMLALVVFTGVFLTVTRFW